MSRDPLSKRKRRWLSRRTLAVALRWYQLLCKRQRLAGERSPFRDLTWQWTSHVVVWLHAFLWGEHWFSPMNQYRFSDEVVRLWTPLDRLMIHLIYRTIRPTFKHVISPLCRHLKGPSAVRPIVAEIKAALGGGRFGYVIRTDMKSYYASINHQILLEQLAANFDDPILLRYFEAIVTPAVDDGGDVFVPTQGLPLRSGLSPFFGALYLTALDRAFEDLKGIFYRRYMDDVIILAETQRQYKKAKKRLYGILRDLKLKVSPRKTWMGRLMRLCVANS